MTPIRENSTFLIGLGTGVVLSVVIGKLASAYGFGLTGSKNDDSDDETEDDSSEWEDEEAVNSDEVKEVLEELGINPEATKQKSKSITERKQPIRAKKKIEDCKMVLVVRSDLKMGKGKAAAQCSHAAVGAYKIAKKNSPSILKSWEQMGQPKIVTKTETEEDLLKIYNTGRSLNLVCTVIQDAGRTQIAPGSKTVVAILGEEKIVDKVTNTLKLY